jgi:hypothetical protein
VLKFSIVLDKRERKAALLDDFFLISFVEELTKKPKILGISKEAVKLFDRNSAIH